MQCPVPMSELLVYCQATGSDAGRSADESTCAGKAPATAAERTAVRNSWREWATHLLVMMVTLAKEWQNVKCLQYSVGAKLKCPLFCKAEMSGSPGGLQAVPSAAVDPSIGATPCLRETSRGGGRRHPRIPFCKSGLQAGCGRASQCSHKTNRHSTAGLGRSARTRPRQAPRRARRKGAHRLLAAGGLGPGRRSTGSSMPLPRKSGHFRIARTGHFSFALTVSSIQLSE